MRFWAPHLSLLPVDEPTGPNASTPSDDVVTFEGWTLSTRTIGSVDVELLTDAATTPLVAAILDSARVREIDDNGCDTSSPVQAKEPVRPPAFDVSSVGRISEVAVCQYLRSGDDSSGLLASRVIAGDAATDLLAAVVTAPAGGGPDRPEQCATDYFGDQAIVLRLRDGDTTKGDLYVYYDWCFRNGIDDGTTRRAITTANCAPLWGDPVVQYSGNGTTFRLCHP
jgi:hypothetical protein